MALPLAHLVLTICGSTQIWDPWGGYISGYHIPTAVTPGSWTASFASSLVASCTMV